MKVKKTQSTKLTKLTNPSDRTDAPGARYLGPLLRYICRKSGIYQV